MLIMITGGYKKGWERDLVGDVRIRGEKREPVWTVHARWPNV